MWWMRLSWNIIWKFSGGLWSGQESGSCWRRRLSPCMRCIPCLEVICRGPSPAVYTRPGCVQRKWENRWRGREERWKTISFLRHTGNQILTKYYYIVIILCLIPGNRRRNLAAGQKPLARALACASTRNALLRRDMPSMIPVRRVPGWE